MPLGSSDPLNGLRVPSSERRRSDRANDLVMLAPVAEALTNVSYAVTAASKLVTPRTSDEADAFLTDVSTALDDLFSKITAIVHGTKEEQS